MPYIPPEVVARAREMDLLTYLRTYEPQELVHSEGNFFGSMATPIILIAVPPKTAMPVFPF